MYSMRLMPLALAAILTLLSGCRSGGIPILNLIPINKPVNVLLLTDSPVESAYALIRYEDFRKSVSKNLGRPVYMELAFPLLAEPGLAGGWQHLAIMSPLQYARLSDAARFDVVVVTKDARGAGARAGVIVVPATSAISSGADLRDKTVAFGPAENARTYHAALQWIESNGTPRAALKRQLLPVPGAFMHLPGPVEIAEAVLSGKADAGVLDAEFFENLPDSAESNLEPGKAAFRVLGRTAPIPDRLIVASPKLDAATRTKLRDIFLEGDERFPTALDKVDIAGFTAPQPEWVESMRRLKDTLPAEKTTTE